MEKKNGFAIYFNTNIFIYIIYLFYNLYYIYIYIYIKLLISIFYYSLIILIKMDNHDSNSNVNINSISDKKMIDHQLQISIAKIKNKIAEQSIMCTSIWILVICTIPDIEMELVPDGRSQAKMDSNTRHRLIILGQLGFQGITMFNSQKKEWILAVMSKGAGVGCNDHVVPEYKYFDCSYGY